MCGLVGMAGELKVKDDVTIKRLLMLDYFRGPDATGLVSIRSGGEAKIAKIANDPPTLFDTQKFKECLQGVTKCFIGHNRWATVGQKTNVNAHPFDYGNVIGAHNGTLDQQSWDRLEKELGEKHTVDSAALIHAISKFGPKKAIELCEEGRDQSKGAWSLVWFDFQDSTINFLRNKHRPMFYAYAKDFKRMYWASEWWMLEAAGHADEIEFHTEGDKGFRFFPTEENIHYKFTLTDFYNATAKPKPKVKEIKGREPPSVVYYNAKSDDPFGRMGFHSTETHTNSSTTSTTKSRGTTTPRSAGDNVLNWLGNDAHPYAGYIDKEKFEEMAKYGCSWCSKDVEFGEQGVTVWESDSMVLCRTCSGNDEDDATRIYVEPSQFVQLR